MNIYHLKETIYQGNKMWKTIYYVFYTLIEIYYKFIMYNNTLYYLRN